VDAYVAFLSPTPASRFMEIYRGGRGHVVFADARFVEVAEAWLDGCGGEAIVGDGRAGVICGGRGMVYQCGRLHCVLIE
jgi:hypothetical protein